MATPFERASRWVALAPPALIGLGLATTIVGRVRDTGLDGPGWLALVAALAALPTLPLFGALPLPDVWVTVLGALTSLPVWAWGGAALARRVEPTSGADWWRWTRWYATFPLVGLFFAFVFIGGLTP